MTELCVCAIAAKLQFSGMVQRASDTIQKHRTTFIFPGMGVGPGFSFSWRPLALDPKTFEMGSVDFPLEFDSVLGSGLILEGRNIKEKNDICMFGTLAD